MLVAPFFKPPAATWFFQPLIGISDGTKDVGTAVEHTALDTAGAGAGAVAGGKLGLTAGLALAPVTGGASAIVVPAASSLLGTIMGVLTGKGISGWFKARHLREAKNKLDEKARRLRRSFLRNFQSIISTVSLFYKSRIYYVDIKDEKEEMAIKRIFFPSLMSKIFMMCKLELREELEERKWYYNKIARKAKRKDPEEGGMILYAQGKSILNGVEPLPSIHDSIEERLEKVKEGKKKLE